MRNTIPIIALVLLIGCASTEMTSVRDPDFKNKKYSHLLVSGGNS